MKKKKPEVKLGKLVKVTAGGRHAWFESNIGIIRKQFSFAYKRS